MNELTQQLSNNKDEINPIAFTSLFHISMSELNAILNVSDTVNDETIDLFSVQSQARLKVIVDILYRVKPMCGTYPDAFEWFVRKRLPGFCERTAFDLLQQDRIGALIEYLDAVEEGGFA